MSDDMSIKYDLGYAVAAGGILLFEDYLGEMERYLYEATGKAKSRHETTAKLPEGDLRDARLEFDGLDYLKKAEGFPRILRDSFLVSTCSFLEQELDRICNRLKNKKKIAIGWRDIRGNTLERFKIYVKLTDLIFPFEDRIWQDLNNYYLVRHCIVHRDGHIDNNDKQLNSYVTAKNIVSTDGPIRTIFLTKVFCAEVISNLDSFFDDVYGSITNGKHRSHQQKGVKEG